MMDSIALERPFHEDEVKNVVFQFGTYKSPRPDGFTMEFFKCG